MLSSFRLVCSLLTLWALSGVLGNEGDSGVLVKPVTEDCLECLCEALSGCNATAICVNGACGIFRITWGFWVEAGEITLENDTALSHEAFTNCVNDPICAADTIQRYMYKYGQDCNDDKLINCLDYGALHKMGNLACQRELPYGFAKIFNKCLATKERQAEQAKALLTK